MLAPWKESYHQRRQHIEKQRHYFAYKVQLVKAMVFPVVMYGFKSWTIKKAEHQRIDAFELWCWRKLLRVPWAARRSNQSILKEISPECSLAGLMLKLKLQYIGHLMWRADSLKKKPWGWERLKAGGEGEDRGWDGWMASLTQWTWVWASSRSWWWTGKPGVLQSVGSRELDTTEQLNYNNMLWKKGSVYFLNYSFVWIYAQDWDFWIMWWFCFQFSEEPPNCFPQQLP